jgi:hypothetical protein
VTQSLEVIDAVSWQDVDEETVQSWTVEGEEVNLTFRTYSVSTRYTDIILIY